MKTCKLRDLFEVKYGVNLELNALEKDMNGINFVSRTSKNNGVSAKVKILPDIEPLPGGTITVAGGGSVMETFLQLSPYYSGRDLYYLTPKQQMSNEVKLYYCMCLRKNKYKFSYGRQANVTLADLLIPDIECIPEYVRTFSTYQYGLHILKQTNFSSDKKKYIKSSKCIPLGELFVVRNGTPSTQVIRSKKKESENWIPYIRPSYRQDTSFDFYVNRKMLADNQVYPAETLYVSTNGQGSHTFSYVSVTDFVPNSDVSVLIPRREMNLQEKLFYAHCITINRYKFSYGRKPKGNRLKTVCLPEFPPQYVTEFDVGKIIQSFSAVLDII